MVVNLRIGRGRDVGKKKRGEKRNERKTKQNQIKERRDARREEEEEEEAAAKKRRDERKEESEDGSERESASRSRSSNTTASDGWLNLPPGYKNNPILLKSINIPVRLSSMVGAESYFQLPRGPHQAMALSSPSGLPPLLLYTFVPFLHSRRIAVVVSTQKKQRRRLDPVACASNRKR